MFVLGPVGVIYNGMSEELKKKADNATVILLIQQQKEENDRQWKEIQRNRDGSPQRNVVVAPKATKLEVKKLTPSEYADYIKMTPQQQEAYRKYRTDVTVWPVQGNN